jgi:hypothetical protein
MIRLLSTISTALLFGVPAAGQETCPGELSEPDVARMLSHLRAGDYNAPEGRRTVITVPITFHAVRDSNGHITHPNAQHLDDRIIEGVELLNAHFDGSGVQFCQAGPTRYIDSDFWAYWRPGATLKEFLQIDWAPGTINIYLFQRPNIGSVIAYTWSPVQSIGIHFGDFMPRPNHSTFAHNVGHYFDLLHTYETAFGQECASGANCATAGDLVCDTPVDQGQPVAWLECEFFFPAPYPGPCPGDPVYTPDLNNIMSGHSAGCRDHFPQGQKDRAYATLVNIRHELSRTMCDCPVDCDLSGTLDINDYLCFVDAFVEGEPYACGMSPGGVCRCAMSLTSLRFRMRSWRGVRRGAHQGWRTKEMSGHPERLDWNEHAQVRNHSGTCRPGRPSGSGPSDRRGMPRPLLGARRLPRAGAPQRGRLRIAPPGR